MRQDLLVVENLSKHYPGVRANDRINFRLTQGSIHAILGENGAGKSTLMHLIYGMTQPTSGRILLEGQERTIKNPAHARSLGIEMVFQHCTIFESLGVLDNLYLSSHKNKAALLKELTRVSEHYALNIDPFQSGMSLSLGQKQRLEIIRCLLNKPKLLILDEPTSTLSEKAAESLFRSLRILAQEGCSILYISHKLAEIQGLCDQATILRLGKVVESFDPKQESPDRIAELMLGKKLEKFERSKVAASEPELKQKEALFAVKNLSTPAGKNKTHLKNIQFELYPGEILGIAGVSNNGQEELYRALSGEDPYYHGKIYLENKLLPRKSSLERRKKGIYAVPEEKLYRGILPDMSLSANFLLTAAEKDFFSHGFLENPKLDHQTEHCIRDFRVKANSPHTKAKALSGGNLQKFMLGREIVKNPKVLLVFNPTWGIDVRAANFVRSSLLKLKQQGCSVILFSEDLEELFSLSDRIAVLFNGKLSPLKEVDAITSRELGLWMAGVPATANLSDPVPSPITDPITA